MPVIQQYLPFLAIFAPIAMFWTQFKSILSRITLFFYKERKIPAELMFLFYEYLSQYRKYNFNDYDITINSGYRKDTGEIKKLIQKTNYLEIFFYKHFIPIIVKRNDDKGSESIFTIRYFSLTFPFDRLLNKFSNSLSDPSNDNFSIYRLAGEYRSITSGSYSTDTISPSNQGNQNNKKVSLYNSNRPYWFKYKFGKIVGHDVNDYSYTKQHNSKNKYVYSKVGLYVKSVVEKWSKSEDWYALHDIRYYRGMLLHSLPGAGKTSLVTRIAKDLGLPLYLIDLSTFDNRSLSRQSFSSSRKILLIEDIDCIFDGRTNLNKTDLKESLTFDGLLNFLGGAEELRNVFVFITTNNIDKLDSALIRPGRCDEIIDFPHLDYDEKCKVAEIIAGPEYSESLASDGTNDTTAEFENRCVSLALANYWNKNE